MCATPVRNAEKTRPFSTCDFADRVFDSVVNKLTDLSPRFLENIKRNSEDKADTVDGKNSDVDDWDGSDAFSDKFSTFNELFGDTQTVCAGIVSYDSVTDELETVAIGVGTKFIENDTNTEFAESRSVVDMHAEALCQAAFLRYLGRVSDKIADVTNALNNSDFFDRIQDKTLTFHMYVSSAPCGNACIRKWGKSSYGSKWSEADLGEKNIHEGILLNMDDKEKLMEHCQKESTVLISDTKVIWVLEILREGYN